MTRVEFLRARLDDRHTRASKMLRYAQENDVAVRDPRLLGRTIPGWHEWPEVEQMAREVLAEVDAKRRIMELHQPDTAWSHGGEDYCMTCGVASEYPTAWPCETVRLLALPYVGHPDYDPTWRR